MGLFSKKSKAPPPKAPAENVTFVAMVLLKAMDLDLDKLAAGLGERFPTSGPATNLVNKEALWTFDFAGETLAVIPLPMRIPKPDMDAAVAASLQWEDSAQAVAQHNAHAIVTAAGPAAKAKQIALTLSRVVAAMADAGSVVAIYWGSAMLLHEPQAFAERVMTSTREELPLELWMSILLAESKAGKPVFTSHGLMQFDLHEVEAPMPKGREEEAVNRVGSLATYLLDRGPVISDGDTFGYDAKDKTKVRIRPSSYDTDRTVYWIDVK